MDQITDFIQKLFGVSDFPARWHCGRWTEFHGWLYIISDLAIFGAYFAIPLLLTYFISKRKDIPLSPIFWLFAAFIFFCGATHLMDAATFWWPAYRFNGLLRLGTATVSWFTVFALVKAVPIALSFKSPRELQEIINRQTTALQQSNEELEQFSYTVSHDLRTPLQSILLSTQLIKEECRSKVDKDTASTIDIMENNIQKMSVMINRNLEYARVDQQDIEFSKVNMTELMNEEMEMVKKAVTQRDIKFEVLPLDNCSGDKELIRRVVANLLSNAVKYTTEKKQALIEAGSETGDQWVTYYIKDNGEGVNPNHHEDVFKLFKRFAQHQSQGSGLGLAIAKKIIERHGGEIWVESRLQEGATFFFTLPAVRE